MSSQNPPPPTDLSITAIAGNIPEGFPATDLIKVLIRYIALDAAKFQRDVQTSTQVFSRSRVAYDAIQELMKKVDESTSIDFSSFDKYTTAIPPLERSFFLLRAVRNSNQASRILLEYYANTPEDKARTHLPPTDGVDSAILFIDVWEADRQMLHKALDDLGVDTFKVRFLLSDKTSTHHTPLVTLSRCR